MIKNYIVDFRGNDIVIQLDEYRPGKINTANLRPIELFESSNDFLKSTTLSLTDTNEVATDILFQINFLNKYVLNSKLGENAFYSALVESCKSHILKYNRLIINDMYTYVDYSIHILIAITNCGNDKKLIAEYYKKYIKSVLKEFKSHIYYALPFGVVKMEESKINNILNDRCLFL